MTLKSEVHAEFEVKRSRFVADVKPVFTPDAAISCFSEIKKKHYGARHVVYAYRLCSGECKSSDAGEPSGTAGKPVLEVLTKNGLFDVVAMVSRYFGGILLGRGGLVRAYGTSVVKALEGAVLVKKSWCDYYKLSVSYSNVDSVLNVIGACRASIEHKEFSERVSLFFFVSEKDFKRLQDSVSGICAGSAEFTYLGKKLCEMGMD